MEAVGSIKSSEIKGVEEVASVKQAALKRQEESKEQKAHSFESRKPAEKAAAREEGLSRIERIAEAMDKYVRSIQRDLDIQVHNETGTVMVKVLSRETGEVIREIPPEELLNLASKMEEVAGVLLNKSA